MEIDLDTVVKGGQVTVYRGSFADVTLSDGGTINVKGNTSAENLTLLDGSLVFNEGYAIDLGGNALTLGDDVVIRLLVNAANEDYRNCTLITNIGEGSENLDNLTVIVSDGSNEVTAQASLKDGNLTVVVPEPTTATLSLLALAALAARRRRK